jgi:hypothetical protein
MKMATAKKTRESRAAKIRAYFTANPDATTTAVAKKFKTSYQIAYMAKKSMEPKKIVVTATEAAMAKRLGVSALDYAKQKAKILKKVKPKQTKNPLDMLPKLGESIGGLTLTRKAEGDHFVYKWVRDALVASGEVLVDAPAEIVDNVNQPAHYKVGGIETIDFIEAKELDYHLGNAVKYISRANHKGNRREDLEKAQWYLSRAISQIKE